MAGGRKRVPDDQDDAPQRERDVKDVIIEDLRRQVEMLTHRPSGIRNVHSWASIPGERKSCAERGYLIMHN